MILRKEITLQIRELLQKNPQGLSITNIVKEVNINRNTAGRYLENLLISGQVDMRRLGMAKIYMISQRVPVSAVLSISSELVIQLDSSLRIVFANEQFIKLVGSESKNLLGKNIEYTPVQLIFDKFYTGFLENIRAGINGKEWSGEITLISKDLVFFGQIAPTVFDDGRKGVSVILQNITDKKRAELKVEESERQFRLLAENSLDMIGLIKPDYTHVYASPAYTTILGYNPEEVIGKPGRLFIHPDDVHIMESVGTILTSQNASLTLRFRSKHKAGHYVWVESHIKAIFDEKTHEVSEYYAVTRDISEQKTTEEALRESEDRYRKLVEISPDAVFLHRDGKIIYANPATFTLLGATRQDEIIGKNVLDFVSPEFRDLVRANIQKDLWGKVSPYTELHMVRIDGTPIIIEGTGIGTETDGKPAVQVAIRDITEQKRTEGALRKSQDLYRTLTDGSTDLIFIIGRDNKLEYVNRFASTMVNIPADQIIGQPLNSIFPPDMAMSQKKALEIVFETGTQIRTEGELNLDERIYWFDHSLTPLKDFEGLVRSVLGISRDITERKIAEKQMYESEGKLNAMLGSITDLMSMIDKDLNILWANELTLRYFGKDIIGRKCYEVYHSRKEPCYPCPSLTVFLNGKMLHNEIMLIDKNGRKRFFEGTANVALRDSSGGPVAVMETAREITDKKNSENELRESETRLRLLLDSTEDLIFMQDPEGRYLYFNATERYGMSREKMIGSTPYDIMDKEPADRIVERVKKVVKTGQSIREETSLVWQGKTLWFIDGLSPVRCANDTITAVVTISHNITDRKHAETALHDSEATSRALINTPTDSVILMDIQGVILALNETTAVRFGKKSAELIGVLIDDILPKEIARARRALFSQVLEKRGMVRFEDEHDGRWYDTVAYPILNDSGEVNKIAVIARDITYLKCCYCP